MLVFGRKESQRTIIVVPPSAVPVTIVVSVESIRPHRKNPSTRLGFVAPREVEIDREEIRDSKEEDARAYGQRFSTGEFKRATEAVLKRA
jgi:sRNA-binding carbon storage regulator CsrA